MLARLCVVFACGVRTSLVLHFACVAGLEHDGEELSFTIDLNNLNLVRTALAYDSCLHHDGS
jgi:hypothetical protein